MTDINDIMQGYEIRDFTIEEIVKTDKDNFNFQERIKPLVKDLAEQHLKDLNKELEQAMMGILSSDSSTVRYICTEQVFDQENYGVICFGVIKE